MAGSPPLERTNDTFQGLLASAGTPPTIIDRLAKALAAILARPDIQAKYAMPGAAIMRQRIPKPRSTSRKRRLTATGSAVARGAEAAEHERQFRELLEFCPAALDAKATDQEAIDGVAKSLQ